MNDTSRSLQPPQVLSRWTRPWLWLPARLAHDLSPLALRVIAAVAPSAKPPRWKSVDWRGLHFPNPLGVAGGVDKSGASVRGWWALGAGFVEVGTVTPLPQAPNEGEIMARDLNAQALWNKMGFPGEGAERVRDRLRLLPAHRLTPVLVNIGKNRTTPNERAADDYVTCVRALHSVTDAFVINVSSPNTKGLRDLQSADALRDFLRTIVAARDACTGNGVGPRPLLIKLSPDLDRDGLASAVDVAIAQGIDGFVTSNTTLAREPGMRFHPTEGGVSGAPLAARSKAALRDLLAELGSRRADRLVISVGGVMSRSDVDERLAMGADLVQVYSALIFQGPGFFRAVARAP